MPIDWLGIEGKKIKQVVYQKAPGEPSELSMLTKNIWNTCDQGRVVHGTEAAYCIDCCRCKICVDEWGLKNAQQSRELRRYAHCQVLIKHFFPNGLCDVEMYFKSSPVESGRRVGWVIHIPSKTVVRSVSARQFKFRSAFIKLTQKPSFRAWFAEQRPDFNPYL